MFGRDPNGARYTGWVGTFYGAMRVGRRVWRRGSRHVRRWCNGDAAVRRGPGGRQVYSRLPEPNRAGETERAEAMPALATNGGANGGATVRPGGVGGGAREGGHGDVEEGGAPGGASMRLGRQRPAAGREVPDRDGGASGAGAGSSAAAAGASAGAGDAGGDAGGESSQPTCVVCLEPMDLPLQRG